MRGEPEHHEGREEKGGRVGEALACNVGRRTVDGLEDGRVLADVARGGQTETADETGGQVGENVTVPDWFSTALAQPRLPGLQVGHDHDTVSKGGGVLGDAQADTVKDVLGVLDVRVLLGDLSASIQEHAVRHLHDTSLVHGGDLWSSVLRCVVEGVSRDPLRRLVGDELKMSASATGSTL